MNGMMGAERRNEGRGAEAAVSCEIEEMEWKFD